jgi:hypothetical protein
MSHHTHVFLRQIGAVLLLCAAGIALVATYHARALASTPASRTSPAALTETAPFEAAVYAGPDKGLSLSGTLTLQATKTGALARLLIPRRAEPVQISGQVNGDAVNLVFYLGGSKHVFGVGTIGQDPQTKQWVAGGPLVGPGPGDSGDWTMGAHFPVIMLAIRKAGGSKVIQ